MEEEREEREGREREGERGEREEGRKRGEEERGERRVRKREGERKEGEKGERGREGKKSWRCIKLIQNIRPLLRHFSSQDGLSSGEDGDQTGISVVGGPRLQLLLSQAFEVGGKGRPLEPRDPLGSGIAEPSHDLGLLHQIGHDAGIVFLQLVIVLCLGRGRCAICPICTNYL
jgi:hypothetical protein